MKIAGLYKWIFLPVLLPAMIACSPGQSRKLNERITLWRKDKIPYGTYFAYESLKEVFPGAGITINDLSPVAAGFDTNEGRSYTDILSDEDKQRKKAYIIISPSVMPDQAEWNAIMDFVGRGNHVFISSMRFSDSLLQSLRVELAADRNPFRRSKDSLTVSVYNPVSNDSLSFRYPGASRDAYASSVDSQYTTILGRDGKGRPDFLRFNYKGGGTLYLHFAPLALTNFFLLHKDNKAYYENVLSYLPASVREVKWDDYFRYRKRESFSALSYILSIESFRWAFWLLILLFLLIYLFAPKRRQRIIPVIPAVRNTSLDFVKTIGRLYYQRRDNRNLAQKMTAHFLDHIRNRYNLPTTRLDNEFADRLAHKSGMAPEQVRELVYTIKTIQDEYSLSDADLQALNKKMEAFYKHA